MTGTTFTSPSSYWQVSRAPRYSLLFALPLLLFYQLLAVLLAPSHRRHRGDYRRRRDFLGVSLYRAIRGSLAALFVRVPDGRGAVLLGVVSRARVRDHGVDARAVRRTPSIYTVDRVSDRQNMQRLVFPVCLRGCFPQFESLNFSGGRLRQLVEEHDPARVLVRRQALFHERLELGLERRARRVAPREHDERERLHQLVSVFRTHHARFHDGRMLGERAFDLRRRHPHAARFDHVVGPTSVPEVAIRVPGVLVARPHPLARERLLGALGLVPVARARAVSLDDQIACLAGCHFAAGIVYQFRLVARYDGAARAGAHLAATVRDERVAQLRRADAVEDLEPELVEPALVNGFRERLSRRAAEPDRPEVVQALGVGHLQHRRIRGRDRVKQGRALPRDDLEHLRGLGTARVQHRRGSDVEREVQRVAQAVREEQLGDREGAVLRPDLEHVAAERFAAHQHVVVQVDGCFGRARRTRGVLPESHVIPARGGGRQLRALGADQVGIGEPTGRRRAYDYHVRESR